MPPIREWPLSLRVPDRCKLESGLTSPVVLQDPETPIEETMDALDAIVKMGKVRYIGMSSCYAYQFHQMQAYAKSRNQTCFISMQDLQVELDFLAAG
jgi:diketogulonate reductase-like aldo/keto reductase